MVEETRGERKKAKMGNEKLGSIQSPSYFVFILCFS